MTAVSPPRTRVRLQDVPELPAADVLRATADHLNRGLLELMQLGGYHAVRPVRAHGAWIETADGRRLLDLVSSYGALSHGHNHPRMLAAARWFDGLGAPDLLKEFPSPFAAALASNLVSLAPPGLESVFFCNSGTEAVEGAMKLAVRASGGRRSRFVHAVDSLHGKTFGSLQVTGREKYRRHVPRFPDWPLVPFGDADAVALAFAEDGQRTLAGVVLEPIQGEGGVVVPPRGYLAEVARLCRAHGALLILDEIQTGLGRTGSLFRCAAEGVAPDVLCLAKSLGGGLATIGATLARRELHEAAYGRIDDCLVHTSTFGGRARSCALAIEAVEIAVEEDFAGRARENGAWLRARLEEVRGRHPDVVAAVRGEGLMLGLEFHEVAPRVPVPFASDALGRLVTKFLPGIVGAALLHDHDVVASFVLNNPRVLRIYPPLVATREDLALVPQALDAVLSRGLGRLAADLLERAVRSEGLLTVLDRLRKW